jgi:integrase
LAALKSFAHFVEYRLPSAIDQMRRILAIPAKKTDETIVPFLDRRELQALLDAPDPTTRDGRRDPPAPCTCCRPRTTSGRSPCGSVTRR